MEINKVTSLSKGNFNPGGNFEPGKIRGLILHPATTDLLSTANLADPRTNLQALLKHNTYSSRGFFIHALGNPEENGEGPAYESIEQFKKRTEKGTFDKIFVVTTASWSDYQALKNFDGRHKQFLGAFVDENNVLRHVNTDTGIAGMRLHALEVLPYQDPAPGVAGKVLIRIALADRNEWDTANHSELGFNAFHPLQGLKGVENVVLTDVTPGGTAAGVFHINAKSQNGEVNLCDLFSTVWNAAGAWTAKNTDGATITISSVSVSLSGTDKIAFILTLDTADTDYDVAESIFINLASISVLSGLGSSYYEALDPVEVTAT